MTFFNDLKNSIFSFSFYREVIDRPVSQAMKFLLGLVSLMTVVLSVRLSFDALGWIEKTADWMTQSLPEIRVVNGEASSAVQQPFQVEVQGKDFVFVLDTTGATQDIPRQYPSGILVTKNQLILKENAFQKREYNLSQLSGLVLNKETIQQLKQTTKVLTVPLVLVGLFLYLFIARLVQVFFFSLVTWIINLAGGIGLSYNKILIMGIYALTPCSLLGTLVGLIGTPLALFPAVYLSCYLTYLILSILQCKKSS